MIEQYLTNEHMQSAITFVSWVIIALALRFILQRYATRLAQKTSTDLDDILLNKSINPMFYLVILLGAYHAIMTNSFFSAYIDLVNNIFYAIVVLMICFFGAQMIGILLDRWLKTKGQLQKTPAVLHKIIVVVIYILGLLLILDHFNVEITPLLATLGVGGLAVGLALQNTLANFFAGLHIISDKPVCVGDFVELQGTELSGYVEDIGWRSTRIRTLPNNIIVVPNSKLAESIIINDSMPQPDMSISVQCGVSYDSDLQKVEAITMDVAKHIQQTLDGAVKDFEPLVRFHTFADSNINFSVNLRVKTVVDRYLVVHEFIKALKERYDHERIEISFPVRKIYQGK